MNRRGGQLAVQPERHEKAQGLRQLTGEVAFQHAQLSEPGDAKIGTRLRDATLERKAAHAMDDREDAAFLEIDRLAVALRRDDVPEESYWCREGVDGAGEMREIGS